MEDDSTGARRGGPQEIPRPRDVKKGQPAPWSVLDQTERLFSLDSLRSIFGSRGPGAPSPQGEDPAKGSAAVLAAFWEEEDDLAVLLTRRRWNLRTHKGEVSFPGGARDSSDPDLVTTALREAHEEVGLGPSEVHIVGELDHLTTVSSDRFIVPYVGVLERPPARLNPHESEVDAILRVSVTELLADQTYRQEIWHGGDRVAYGRRIVYDQRPINFFELHGDTIWGATATMLTQLLAIATQTRDPGTET